MSTNHTNTLLDPLEDGSSPHTPIKNSSRAGNGQDGQGYVLSPPPAPKASQRAYRLTNDERRMQDISQIARKLSFDDREDDKEKRGIRHARNACNRGNDRRDREDDGRPMNSIRFDGTYTFMDDIGESSMSRQPPKSAPRKPALASKMPGSPIRIHPAHLSPPQSLSSNSDTLQSSGSTLFDSPLSGEDDAKLGRKRARSIDEEDSEMMPLPDTQNFRSTHTSNHVDNFKYTLSSQRIHGAYTGSSSNQTLQNTLGESFDPFMKSSSNTPFLVQLQRTATHAGTNDTVQQSVPFIKQTHLLKHFQEHESSSSMHRSVSNASYLIRTPNELREAPSSKMVVAPRLKYNMAVRSIHHPKQSRRHDRSSSILANSKPLNFNAPSLCASFSNSNSPSPVLSNSALPNVFSSQPMDYFGTWSAASSPLTQAH
ncbi:uncharacterized protein FA14DRAFT_154407 [Meira miltonrushii]|uniref:Uncharacterized protein n=1 Tax=Meira miltonrushii TaxID=1280837 RepID=A0A316VCE6_9BASI|nr:uncharacterized protein FA14DRAFT_154407 [Meira miltonrushii]PWN34974.1 hypothetical protein FA14DRAFT_154407 [Meira miltonrushii]